MIRTGYSHSVQNPSTVASLTPTADRAVEREASESVLPNQRLEQPRNALLESISRCPMTETHQRRSASTIRMAPQHTRYWSPRTIGRQLHSAQAVVYLIIDEAHI
jgi:hypothetical protein